MPGIEAGQRQAWLSAVLNLLPMPAQVVDPGTGRILFANEAARAAIPDVPGAGVAETPRATDAGGLRIDPECWPHRRVARGEKLENLEVTWQTSAGDCSSYLVSSGTVPGWNGERPLVLLTYADVSRLRCAEAELREAVRVRDEFFAFATHELKDPLASLLLSVGFLLRVARKQGNVPTPMLIERLESSERQGQQLGQIIQNLLDVSRIRHGGLQLQVEALDLVDLARDVAGRYREQAREARSPIEVDAAGPIIGYFDRIQIEHAIGNLVSNALKYGGGRPVTVRVVGGEAVAWVEVEDRGRGIAEADRGRIFERFERASDDHREQSLGLGLYIVRTIAEAHGGTVEARSEPGRGTTFVVELPRKRMPGHGPATTDGPAEKA